MLFVSVCGGACGRGGAAAAAAARARARATATAIATPRSVYSCSSDSSPALVTSYCHERLQAKWQALELVELVSTAQSDRRVSRLVRGAVPAHLSGHLQ
mmetsp:Transcript_49041/g.142132  ORF Transcript_49041/g.142132 Transcript_49041/m.142132 type:complete len:99 (-) Transcript_49041:116-412(-)